MRVTHINFDYGVAGIAGASFVVTNSFHGTVFAILFRKPFLTIPLSGSASSMNDRIYSLLERLGLYNRIYRTGVDVSTVLEMPIDWADVQSRLDIWRNESDAYFSKMGI